MTNLLLLLAVFFLGFLIGSLRMYLIGYRRYQELDLAHKKLEAQLHVIIDGYEEGLDDLIVRIRKELTR